MASARGAREPWRRQSEAIKFRNVSGWCGRQAATQGAVVSAVHLQLLHTLQCAAIGLGSVREVKRCCGNWARSAGKIRVSGSLKRHICS